MSSGRRNAQGKSVWPVSKPALVPDRQLHTLPPRLIVRLFDEHRRGRSPCYGRNRYARTGMLSTRRPYPRRDDLVLIEVDYSVTLHQKQRQETYPCSARAM